MCLLNEDQWGEEFGTRENWVAHYSHEMRTPLTSLKLQMTLARQRLLTGDVSMFSLDRLEKLISDQEKQIERLIGIVDEMSKLQQDPVPIS